MEETDVCGLCGKKLEGKSASALPYCLECNEMRAKETGLPMLIKTLRSRH